MRLIDADVLKEKLYIEDDKWNPVVTEKEIDETPTVDAVPVVWCKDCDLLQNCKISQYLGLDGFCSNADMRKKVE